MAIIKNVPDRLRDAAKLFEERNAAYGGNYTGFPAVLEAMFPEGVTLNGGAELARFAFICQLMMKLTRYGRNVNKGGHDDSLEDMAVYAIMSAELDGIAKMNDELRIEKLNRLSKQFGGPVNPTGARFPDTPGPK